MRMISRSVTGSLHARISGSPSELDLSDDSDSSFVTIVRKVDLVVELTAPISARPGEALAATMTVRNVTAADATGVEASLEWNAALLLSPTARIDTKPQLEIFADDVKCTHGATIGKLDEQALFYLKSRGIGGDNARALLTYAFAAQVLETIEIDALRLTLERAIFQRFTNLALE